MTDGAFARNSDPETAIDAAAVISVAQAEMAVFNLLRKRLARGATSDEAASLTGIPRVTVSPRFRPLERKGLIEDSGERRKGSSGRYSIVWKLVPEKAKFARMSPAKKAKAH